MFDIPSNPSITYLIYSLISLGIFLFISGLNIIKIEKIRVQGGAKTWVIGLLFIIIGAILLNDQKNPDEMINICYLKQMKDDNKSYTFEKCHESSTKCKAPFTHFGRHSLGKEANMALQRCISNTPHI